MIKILFYILFIILLIFLSLLISIFITGREKRDYPVLNGESIVNVNGVEFTIQELANEYKPIMYKQSAVITPPILWVWYNAVDAGDDIDFIYYNVWENEINPNPLIHRYYSFFRAFYYGYPLYDIEYVQITVSKLNGAVKKIMFETGPSNNYYNVVNEHIVLIAKLSDDGIYNVQLSNRETKQKIDTFDAKIEFQANNLKLGVQTWNHLSTLIASNESEYTDEVPYIELDSLSDTEYAKYKFVRKSQGDHVTHENRISILISVIAIFIFVALPAKALSRKRGG